MDLNCPGCGIEYDTVEREPQNLSCGCDLCLFCVEEKSGQPTCPEGHNVDWRNISVSRRVLKMVQAAQSACPVHKGRPYDFWCPTCRVPLCGICAVSHKDVCLRASGGGIGSSNPSFYLIEMNNPSASEDLIRLAQEHSKAIEQSMTDLEDAIPAPLLKTPDEFAEFVQNKALEAVQNFYHNLEKSVGEMWDRYNKEREQVLKEEEKRDSAVLQLSEVKSDVDMAVMELNVAVVSYRDAEKEDKAAQDADRDRQQQALKEAAAKDGGASTTTAETFSSKPQPSPEAQEKAKAKNNANKEMCEKAGSLASMVQKLVSEQTNGALKGSVACSNIRCLSEVNVVNLEPLHPHWTTPDPPAKSCPLYKGIVRVRPAFSSTSDSTYYSENANLMSGTGAGASVYHQSSVSRQNQGSSSSASGLASAPRGSSSSSYEARNLSPSSHRRPRLMESLWREQIREGSSTTAVNNNNNQNYSPPSTRLTSSSSANPMMSPGGTSASSARSARRY